jgi:hypothetical protein
MKLVAAVAVVGAVVVGALGVAERADAAALNLVPGRPDVHSAFITVSYDFATSTLTANGFTDQVTLNFVDPSVNLSNPLRAFTLSAVINHDGTFTGVGSVSMSGNYPPPSSNVVLLSGGSLSSFGFTSTALEFVFSSGGGSFNPLNQNVGLILSDPSFVFPGFGASFSNVAAGSGARADAWPIPAPGVGGLLGAAGVLAGARRRRR